MVFITLQILSLMIPFFVFFLCGNDYRVDFFSKIENTFTDTEHTLTETPNFENSPIISIAKTLYENSS